MKFKSKSDKNGAADGNFCVLSCDNNFFLYNCQVQSPNSKLFIKYILNNLAYYQKKL